MSKGKVLITPRAFAKSGEKQIQRMIDAGYDVQVNRTGKSYTYAEFVEYAKDVDGIIIGVDEADRGMLQSCPQLKAIAKYGVGVDNIDLAAAKTLNIEISRTIGSNSRSVAEHTIALMFACAKNIVKTSIDVKSGQWNKPYGIELEGKTLGIIGYGNIGQRVAAMAKGIGMTVFVYDVFPIDQQQALKDGVEIKSFDTLIQESDVITVHLPLTETTANLIHEKTLSMMKKGVIIINAARGGVVDEAALLEKLNDHHVFAAGFDVFSSEPPQKDSALVTNVDFILTPHIASKTLEADLKTMEMAVTNILDALERSVK